jgi:hypothetical protein
VQQDVTGPAGALPARAFAATKRLEAGA